MAINTAKEGNGGIAITLNTDTQIVPARQARLGLLISNYTTGTLNLVFQEGASGGPGSTPAATGTTGFQLANGASLMLAGDTNFLGEIRGFASASGTVGVVDF